MKKITLLLIIFLLIPIVCLHAEVGLKCGFDSNGCFNNRLKFNGKSMGFSLLSAVSVNGFEWVEPTAFLKPLSIGRIKLEGIVRELHNPDGNSPSASVLTENSGLRVTDSMSRSSRYGILIAPLNEHNFSAWLYRANSGLISTGLFINQTDIIKLPLFCMEGEFILTAGSYDDCAGSEWFGSTAALSQQLGLNTAVELRLSAGNSVAGRRMMIPDGDKLSGKFSFTAACSIPEYTGLGGLIRTTAAAGTRDLYLRALFQSISPNYIASSGEVPSYGMTAGAGISLAADIGFGDIDAMFDYCLKRRIADVIPARYIEQTEAIDCSLKFVVSNFDFKINGSYGSFYMSNGMIDTDAGFETRFKFDFDVIRLELGCGREYKAAGSLMSWGGLGVEGGVSFISEAFRFGINCGYEELILSFKIDAVIVTEVYRVTFGLKMLDLTLSGLTIGFEF